MSRTLRLRLLVAGVGAVLAAGGCQGPTGVHVLARLGQLEYDELRVGVVLLPAAGTGAAEQTLVDPATRGRYAGPFQPGDQDTYVYLADDLDGARVRCAVTLARAGAAVAATSAEATVQRHVMTDVEVFVGVAPPDGGGGGGSGGGGGGLGRSCSTAADCASGHCADGICCESDCNTSCVSCAQLATPGLCRPVPLGTPDPRGMCLDMGAATCQTDGLCDVSGHCAMYPMGAVCADATCMNANNSIPPSTCDGAGTCQSQSKVKCAAGTSCVAGVCQ